MKSLYITIKYMFLFLLGGNIYYTIEMIYRHRSHWTMYVLGGIVFVYAGIQNEFTSWETPFWRQVLRVEIFVLVSEFITGCIVNLWMKWNVWDYSNLPGNILGQTCWQFALLFLPLSVFAIVFDDWIRWKFFGEEFKPYRWF